ncbi:MAG: hypothetical protein N2606_05720 [Candidatus Omnitrophica bacterium]|nr:hypothetical protein [Candidatus Omnitrophota bacterium]
MFKRTRIFPRISKITLLVAITVCFFSNNFLQAQNFLDERTNTNEMSAITYLKMIAVSAKMYFSKNQKYPSSLAQLTEGPLPLIPPELASGGKNGYGFALQPKVDENRKTIGFSVNAWPLKPGFTGNKYFYTDESEVIRYSLSGNATVNDKEFTF